MKGQSALEFMLLVGFVMFMFVALYGVLNMQLSDRAQQGIYESLLDRSQVVQEEIALAHASEDGYRRVFTLDVEVYGQPYNMTIVDGFVYTRTLDGTYALSLPVMNVTGQLIMGANVIETIDGDVRLN
ncbi:MAG: hypothetical protein AABX12_03785 [Nanoarchaeota archaeon]